MGSNNTKNQRRQPGRKAEDFRLAWKNQAPDTLFGGKSLADLDAAMAAEVDAASTVKELKIQREGALKKLADQQDTLRNLLRAVIRGVQADPSHGEDSALYRSMGYVPISERASGLSRRPQNPPSGQEETAA